MRHESCASDHPLDASPGTLHLGRWLEACKRRRAESVQRARQRMLFGCHSACHCTPLVYPRSAAPRTLPASPEQSPGTLPESFEHVARFRFVDVPLHVFGKKEAIFLELVGRLRDFLHVASVILVALLERFARVADGLAL